MKKVFIGSCMLMVACIACGSAFALHDPVAAGACPTGSGTFNYAAIPIFPTGANDAHGAVTTWPTTYDFCGMLDQTACSVNLLGAQLGDLISLVPMLQCVNADINGPLNLDPAATLPVTPNGIPDGQYELGVLGEALNNAANPYHAQALSIYQANFLALKNLVADALVSQGYWSLVPLVAPQLVGSLAGVLAGYAELGDANTNAALNAILDLLKGIGVVVPPNGITDLCGSIPALGRLGDADHDGYSNQAEYNYFGKTLNAGPAATIAAIFSASQMPPATTPRVEVLGAGTLEEGAALDLKAVALNCTAASYAWAKNGSTLGTETGSSLIIPVLSLTDSGSYVCTVTTADKTAGDLVASNPVTVTVVPAGTLPIAGGLGLALLAGACALGGVGSIRRRK